MFFRCRRRPPFLALLMLLFGLKWVSKERLSDDERAEYRSKARRFRTKLREAFSVWDEEEQETASVDED